MDDRVVKIKEDGKTEKGEVQAFIDLLEESFTVEGGETKQ